MTMDRPVLTRRQVLGAGIAGAVTATSGCLGGGGGGDGDGGDGGDGDGDGGTTTATPTETTTAATTETATETPTPTATETTTTAGAGATGRVTADEVEEIEIVDWTSQALPEDDIFQVEVTLRNAGSKDVRITPGRYRVEVTLYGEDGSELADTYAAVLEDTDLPAGETRWVVANAGMDDPSRVASYELRLVCGGMSMAEYCG